MLTGQPLVPSEMAANDGTMLGWLIAMAGHKDYHTVPSATLNTKYFDENGTAHSSTYASDPDIAYSRLGSFKLGIPGETLESRIVASGVVPADSIPGIIKFIQACLTLDPATRPSPDDLFRSEWVRPGLEG